MVSDMAAADWHVSQAHQIAHHRGQSEILGAFKLHASPYLPVALRWTALVTRLLLLSLAVGAEVTIGGTGPCRQQ
jgi:hypothetical protein